MRARCDKDLASKVQDFRFKASNFRVRAWDSGIDVYNLRSDVPEEVIEFRAQHVWEFKFGVEDSGCRTQASDFAAEDCA